MYPVCIRQEPARRLAALPHRGPYQEISRAFARLGALMAARGLQGHVTGMIAIGYDDPAATAAADLRSHAAVVVDAACPLAPPLETLMLGAGPHAVLRATGPYSGLAQAYHQLYHDWLPKSGRAPIGRPAFELYLNTPIDTAPEALITEICLPLK